mmetsp:Transcript_30685/g.76862  ORF Transcript_30685/g.76862 Transcript_30685/m.76862 type:complete len:151 (-) Transcript_30685:3255-3707(-)
MHHKHKEPVEGSSNGGGGGGEGHTAAAATNTVTVEMDAEVRDEVALHRTHRVGEVRQRATVFLHPGHPTAPASPPCHARARSEKNHRIMVRMVRGSCLHEHISSHGLLPRRFCAYDSINKPSTASVTGDVDILTPEDSSRRLVAISAQDY